MDRRLILKGMAALSLGRYATAGAVEKYPTKPIKIVVGFVPGGVTDVLARSMAPQISESLGQPVIVENRPGAAGAIAAAQVAKSPADGYTLVMVPGTHLIAHAMNPNPQFHAVNDFTAISLLTTTPTLLVVRSDSPFTNLADYVAAAKKDPNGVSYATGGAGTTTHLGGELFAREAGIKLNHVPFKGSNQSIEAVLAGHVASSMSGLSPIMPFLKAGRVRVLGAMTEKRVTALPAVPTFSELGYQTVLNDTWIGLLGPARMAPAIASQLNDVLLQILSKSDFKQRVYASGSEPVGVGLDAFRERMQRELEGYTSVIKSANIKAD